MKKVYFKPIKLEDIHEMVKNHVEREV